MIIIHNKLFIKPSFLLELLKVDIKNARNFDVIRFGRLLYSAFRKNNMIVATRNTVFSKRCTFDTFRYA